MDNRNQNNQAQRQRPGDEHTRIQGAVGSNSSNANKRAQGVVGANHPAPKRRKQPQQGEIKVGIVAGRVVLNIIKALFVLACFAMIIGGIVGVQAIQYVVEVTSNDEELLDLENFSMAQTGYFMALNPDNPNAKEENDYIEHQQLVGDENRTWVSISEVPQDLINAVVATEDREFWDHHGVNITRTALALINEVIPIEGMYGGASTITQQLVKNLTDDDVVEEDGDRTAGYLRKLREIFRAWGLENSYSKEMILESYLNTIGLSGRIAGVEAGAQTYFDKSVSELTLAECATIAGITQAPTYYSPLANPDNALERRNDVIYFMQVAGYITEAEAEEVYDMPLGIAERKQTASNSGTTSGVFSYAVDKAYTDVLDDLQEQKGWSYDIARQYLYNGGLRIYLTVDLNVQEALDNIMVTGYDEGGFFMDEERFPNYASRMTVTEEVVNDAGLVIGYQDVLPQAAVAVVNYEGELIATSGGIGEKTSSLSLNRAIGELRRDEVGNLVLDENGIPLVDGTLRQVGSTMKSVGAYAIGIDHGIISYSKMVLDSPVQARDQYNPTIDPVTGAIVKDWPRNASGTYREAKIPVAAALAESTNTVAVQVGTWVGTQQMFEFMTETLQLSGLVYPNDVDLGPLVLGSQTHGVSAYEMAGAYAMFGGEENYGLHTSLHSYVRVEDAKGNIVLEPEITTVQAISSEAGYVMNRMLSNVVSDTSVLGVYPTARGMAPEGEMDAIGKTGTTTDHKDRWFIGATPYYVTSVWWGYDQDHTLSNWGVSSSTHIGANVWKALMEDVQAELEYKEFPPMPEGVQELAYCSTTGNLASEGCPVAMGYYTSNGIPEQCIGVHTPEVPVV